MWHKCIIAAGAIFVIFLSPSCLAYISPSSGRAFPPGFMFGAATASYQVEGAWNVSDKGESIWDRFVHARPEAIVDGTNGDVAADSYHHWREDIEAAAAMGLDFYRFSISWPRLLPTGLPNKISKDGARYYSKLIEGLLARGIQPIVTLFHWDLPQKLQDLGGWTNPLIAHWFGDYARVVFQLYADRVQWWLTINEAVVVCDFAYNSGILAPGITERILAPYICNKNILLAHAKAYRIYEEEFKHKYNGRVSLANNLLWIEPYSKGDERLAEQTRQFQAGRYCHPIFSRKGGWPPEVEKLMLEVSLREGLNQSRLPRFTEWEKKFIQGTFDYFGMNYYTTRLVTHPAPGQDPGVFFIDGSPELNAVFVVPPDVTFGASELLSIYPRGLRSQMLWVKQQYGDVDILITENGYSNVGSLIHDKERIRFIRDHLEQVLLSIKEDKVSCIGYTVWSLIDNFEWSAGLSIRFGMYQVDYNDPAKRRIPRDSSYYYANIIATRTLDIPEKPYHSKSGRIRRTGPGDSPDTNSAVVISSQIVFVSLAVLLINF